MHITELLDRWPYFLTVVGAIGFAAGCIVGSYGIRSKITRHFEDITDTLTRTEQAEECVNMAIADCDTLITAYLKVWQPPEPFRGMSSRRVL